MLDKNGVAYAECIVGNIIGNHYWGENKEIRSGTKQFGAGAKVYCVFMYGGIGQEQIRVLGKPRKCFRMVDVVIRAIYIKNFRVQKVYEPRVLAFLEKYPYGNEDYLYSAEHMEILNAKNAEIKEV